MMGSRDSVSLKDISLVPPSSYLPNRPRSVVNFFGNRAIAFWKIVVSGVTVVFSGLSSLAFFAGKPKERAIRTACAAALFFHGIRQFFYTADREEPNEDLDLDGNSYGKRFFTTLHIGNVALYDKVEDYRPIFARLFAIKATAGAIFGFRIKPVKDA